MRLNHLNLTVTDVPAAAEFLVQWFGLTDQGGNADKDDFAALVLGKAGCRHADDDRIIARQDQIDDDDLAKRDQFGPKSGQIHEVCSCMMGPGLLL